MNVVALALLAGLAADVKVAGSIYLNQPTLFGQRTEVLGTTVRGMNAETTLKLVVDVNEHISASVKICSGCHGFAADQAHVDWTIAETANIRLGRFPVPFGEFYLRHDPANHRSASKPLPYMMGRMIRRDDYNLAILPEPYPDNGVEFYGTARGDTLELAYSLYAVAGLKGSAAAGDLDFIRTRSEYFADNNRTPATGGRMALSIFELPTDAWRLFSVGLSAMYGYYDDDDELGYLLAGADIYTRVGKLNLRGEVMMRRTDLPDRPGSFRQVLEDRFSQREGFYVQLDGPINSTLEWLARYDGFRLSSPVRINSSLPDTDSNILRYTAGLNVLPVRGVKLKINYELWQFSDFPTEHLLHTGLVGTF